eukprot:m.73524 g.73524  ORF g.73524 m.73524 type:complete len:84 (-) comp13899_c0_seq2:83-334(-)
MALNCSLSNIVVAEMTEAQTATTPRNAMVHFMLAALLSCLSSLSSVCSCDYLCDSFRLTITTAPVGERTVLIELVLRQLTADG